jgi:hypothetical protein
MNGMSAGGTMTTISRDAVLDDVHAVLARYGLSLADFIELGDADELDADELRDLWLMTKAVLRP